MQAQDLTKRQKAGQRIMAGFTGTSMNADLRYLIDTLCVGGIILFSRNVENKEQVGRLCTDVQNYARTCGNPPLIISVDQEGGAVARLKPPDFSELPAPSRIRDIDDARRYAQITASELRRAGINMNMAPVMDVADPSGDSIMAGRAFAGGPEEVAEKGCALIRGLQENHVMAVAKHFPGIGRTTTDSHAHRPDLATGREALAGRDLVPFYAAVQSRAAGIMISHVRYAVFDPIWPASLSPAVADGLLRHQMGYTGLVITDDLEMGAIANYYEMPEAAGQILAADIDIALICHTMPKIESAFETVYAESADPENARRMSASVSRILAAKRRYIGS